jgi:phage FluMu protein Com
MSKVHCVHCGHLVEDSGKLQTVVCPACKREAKIYLPLLDPSPARKVKSGGVSLGVVLQIIVVTIGLLCYVVLVLPLMVLGRLLRGQNVCPES